MTDLLEMSGGQCPHPLKLQSVCLSYLSAPLCKLTDKWDVHVGPLNGSFPILSLRTNKADVAVGVPQEVADKLDAAGEKWRINGRCVFSKYLSWFLAKISIRRYALVSFLPKSE